MHTWDEAASRWLDETRDKADHARDVQKLSWVSRYLSGKLLSEITGDHIAQIASAKRLESATATVNRYLAVVRAVLRRAQLVWQWVDRIPKVQLQRELHRRIRWLTAPQAQRLLSELPEHQRDAALLALSTGLRHGNVVGLEWSQIDLPTRRLWIHPDQSKSRKPITVPLNDAAAVVLERWRGRHALYVFVYRGKRIGRLNTAAWKKAQRRAGIENFRWHDLRHTWASWHAQMGTPLYALQDLGGWNSEAMVRRYAHLAPSQFAAYAQCLLPLLPPQG
ncbi:tyrosine-type recombinase/integrase [Lysobacter capsici]|uniref:tyrosine-type recombinase/integrase n=1 Tax=Lysobacter capsici TaxID=435897 RepID=UPI001C007ABD|nr:site-specific integrase [Lysobacter capsici]QWF18578.1 site-specific integrase [Lysobacter capsici]